jgi:hypothetical protein
MEIAHNELPAIARKCRGDRRSHAARGAVTTVTWADGVFSVRLDSRGSPAL